MLLKLINKIICDNFDRYEIRCQLVLITNRKSHTSFRLAPTSVTLNGVIKHLFCVISLTSIALEADYVRVIEDITYTIPKYRIPVTLTQAAVAVSLCDS